MISLRVERPHREILIDYKCWAITNLTKLNKDKCQILHLGWCNPGYMYRSRAKRLECSPAERNLRVLVDAKLYVSQLSGCPVWSQELDSGDPCGSLPTQDIL